MTGPEFLASLKERYTTDGQPLYKNYSFHSWARKKDGSLNFQFNQKNRLKKSIPQMWLADAREAKNMGEIVDRKWFNARYGRENNDDCRASIVLWLLKQR